MPDKSLNDCATPSPSEPINLDPNVQRCDQDFKYKTCDGELQSKFYKEAVKVGLDVDSTYKKYNLGHANYCDPMLTGEIVEDPNDPPLAPDRSVVYNYNQALRAADMATKDLFSNIKVIDDNGKVMPVPIIWGSQEKAVAVILQQNVRKDNTGVVDRIRLPIMSIYGSSHNFTNTGRWIMHTAINYKRFDHLKDALGHAIGSPAGVPGWTIPERRNRDTVLGVTRGIPVDIGYTLTVWTRYWEDMNQIVTQITTKFSPVAYIRIQGVTEWETIVKLDNVTNNLDVEPGDKNIRVFKFVFNLTTETFIPQPVVRRKAVLDTKIDLVDSINEQDIQEIISRIEETVGDEI